MKPTRGAPASHCLERSRERVCGHRCIRRLRLCGQQCGDSAAATSIAATGQAAAAGGELSLSAAFTPSSLAAPSVATHATWRL